MSTLIAEIGKNMPLVIKVTDQRMARELMRLNYWRFGTYVNDTGSRTSMDNLGERPCTEK